MRFKAQLGVVGHSQSWEGMGWDICCPETYCLGCKVAWVEGRSLTHPEEEMLCGALNALELRRVEWLLCLPSWVAVSPQPCSAFSRAPGTGLWEREQCLLHDPSLRTSRQPPWSKAWAIWRCDFTSKGLFSSWQPCILICPALNQTTSLTVPWENDSRDSCVRTCSWQCSKRW